MPKRSKSTTDQQDASSSSKRVKTSCLQELQGKFEKLNVFCAFCDANLTTSITLQSLQKAVSDLTVEDLASINVIVPNFIKFNYVSNDILEIEFGRPANKKLSKQKHAQAIGNRGDDWFRGFSSSSRNRDESAPKPVKPDAVKKLVEQQNKLFDKALTKFIKHCDDKVIFFCVSQCVMLLLRMTIVELSFNANVVVDFAYRNWMLISICCTKERSTYQSLTWAKKTRLKRLILDSWLARRSQRRCLS